MKTIESTYIKILSKVVEVYHKNLNNVDPRQINKAKFYTRALFMAYSYVAGISKKEEELTLSVVSQYLKTRFGNNNLFSYLIDSVDKTLLDVFDNEEIPISYLPIGSLYENLLNIETAGMEIKTGKEYRNKLGSYYTPKDYAYGITNLTLLAYFRQMSAEGSILLAKFVDFSCGCGIFLVSALSNLKDRGLTNAELKTIVHNLYACDVDPIALEIAKISVLDFCNAQDCYDSVSKNFHHANFLLHTGTERSRETKLAAAMEGYIYHKDLAVGISFLQEYDVILGNPPWEKIRFEEKKFYSQYMEQIEYVNFKFDLSSTIADALQSNPYLSDFAESYKSELESAKEQIKHSEFFKDSTKGELNTCTLFSDAAYKLSASNGCVGLFVKSSLVTAKINSMLFSKIINRIIAVYDFINRKKIFEIDSRERFAILLFGNRVSEEIHLGMNLLSLDEIESKSEMVPIRMFSELNPETKMIPNLSSSKDINILTSLYKRFQIFSKLYPTAKFGRLVHLTNHIDDIDKVPSVDNIPVFEGKFFSLFDNSYSGFNDVPFADRYKSKAASRKISDKDKKDGVKPLCRFYIKKRKWESLSKDYCSDYMVAWHSLTSATNVRSCVATLLPFIPGAQSVQFLTLPECADMIYVVGIFNSIVFDYIIKCKLNGIDLTQAIINQIPLPSPKTAKDTKIYINGDVVSAWRTIQSTVSAFYKDDNDLKNAFIETNNEPCLCGRGSLFKLLDAVVAKLYGLSSNDLEYVLSHFNDFYTPEERQEVLETFKSLNH